MERTLLERLDYKINWSYDEMVEMLEEESIEDITEFIQEREELYSNYKFIQRLLINDDGKESELIDKIIRMLSARNAILKDNNISAALYTLKR